ncbi:MAG: septum site-determining protein MinC [Lachnospiraceae bacterium]|nr:septum site-determining protein MinC [Lachnospiraceae bacterium]
MIQPVIIKSNRFGINLKMDPDMEFRDLMTEITSKFIESADFFKNAKFAITFEGRELTEDEESEIIHTIQMNTDIEIVCVMESGTAEEKRMEAVVKNIIEHREVPINSEKNITPTENTIENPYELASIYKGTLRNGQAIDSEASIVVVGDVNPGASVSAAGNVIVLGSLKGNAFAGHNGDDNCFVYALDMNPMQIRIADAIGRSADNENGLFKGIKNKKKKKEESITAQIATAIDGRILIEPALSQLFDRI